MCDSTFVRIRIWPTGVIGCFAAEQMSWSNWLRMLSIRCAENSNALYEIWTATGAWAGALNADTPSLDDLAELCAAVVCAGPASASTLASGGVTNIDKSVVAFVRCMNHCIEAVSSKKRTRKGA